jgi:hypothetical protein
MSNIQHFICKNNLIDKPHHTEWLFVAGRTSAFVESVMAEFFGGDS